MTIEELKEGNKDIWQQIWASGDLGENRNPSKDDLNRGLHALNGLINRFIKEAETIDRPFNIGQVYSLSTDTFNNITQVPFNNDLDKPIEIEEDDGSTRITTLCKENDDYEKAIKGFSRP